MAKNLRLILVFLFSLVVFTGCTLLSGEDSPTDQNSQENTQTNPQSELLSSDSQAEQSILDANLKEATDLSKSWQLDATLSYVEIQIPSDFSKNNGSELYVFSSETDKANWWTFSLNQATDKFVRAIIPKEDFLGFDATKVDSKYWKMNYIKALQLVDAGGGAEFRINNPLQSIKAYLKQRQPNGWLWWTVEYTATNGTTFERIINPFDAEIRDPQNT